MMMMILVMLNRGGDDEHNDGDDEVHDGRDDVAENDHEDS